MLYQVKAMRMRPIMISTRAAAVNAIGTSCHNRRLSEGKRGSGGMSGGVCLLCLRSKG
jgi:hypothetical protein